MHKTCLEDEKELLLKLQSGDEHAFTKLYNFYWKSLFFLAAHKLSDLNEAEEIVQDIFCDLWKRRAELQIDGQLSAYLAISVKYKVIKTLAKKSHQLKYHQHITGHHNESDHCTEHTLSFSELKVELEKGVAHLPEKCRMVFQLSRNNGKSNKQIAEELGIAEKTVESHLTKALQFLRLRLAQFFSFMPFFEIFFLIYCLLK